MTTFGKRGLPIARAATPSSVAPDLGAARQVLESGKMPGWASVPAWKLLAGLAFFLACAAIIGAIMGGALVRDVRLAGTWAPAPDIRAEDGRCRSRWLIMTDCRVTLVSSGDAGERRQDIDFTMAFTSGDGEALIPVRSTRDPQAVSVSYAVEDELANRVLTFIALELATLMFCAFAVRRLAAGQYQGGRAYQALVAGVAAAQRHQPSAARAAALPERSRDAVWPT